MLVHHREYIHLKHMVLKMASLTQDAVHNSVKALLERNSNLAAGVIRGDRLINDLDVKIDEECINLFALSQPAGRDLRFIITAMKIITDIERIADNAVNIAERALELNKEPPLTISTELPEISSLASYMVREAINSFILAEKERALDVILRDDQMDRLNRAFLESLMFVMTQDPSMVYRCLKLSYVSKYLERIGDHATNVAEMVIYMVEGRMRRHLEPHQLLDSLPLHRRQAS